MHGIQNKSYGVNSNANESNLLESINLALHIFDKVLYPTNKLYIATSSSSNKILSSALTRAELRILLLELEVTIYI
jgi:hypothetical protein